MITGMITECGETNLLLLAHRIGELDLDDEDKAIFSSKKRGL